MIQDPAGLLQRIPELQALCEDARLRRAVESGDSFKVYRALRWARWTGRLRSQREVLDALLSRRRLFAKPIKGTPWLGTLNGFGAGLLGAAEQDARDGTSIATHSIVALFAVPVLPLGAYVVRPAEGGGPFSKSWSIFARVPMGGLPWLYNRAVALGAVALVGVGALGAYRDSRSQDVHLVNGFAEELEVTLAGQTQRVPAGEVRVLNVPTGVQQGRARSLSGVEVDAVQLTVRSDVDVLGWNIAGAAPVFQDVVVYSSKASKPNDAHEPTAVYCGQRTFEVRDAQDIFTKPPTTVSMSSGQTEVRRTYVDLARSGTAPLEMCLGYLSNKNRRAEALPFVEGRARLEGWGEEVTALALQVANAADAGAAVRVMQQALAAHPEQVKLHRMYQFAAERAGKLEALRAEYRARAAQAPDSVDAQYLYARLLDAEETGPAMERLVQRFPEDANVLRSAIYSRVERGDWKGVAEGWQRLSALDEAQAAEQLENHVLALVALGRGDEALRLLQGSFEREQGPARFRLAELYARVAHALEGKPGALPADTLFAKLEGEEGAEALALLRVRAGLKVEAKQPTAVQRLMELIAEHPDGALEAAQQVSQAEAGLMDHGTWALAYSEALRTGNAAAVERLKDAGFVSPRTLPRLSAFVRGEAVPLAQLDLDPELRAAACLVRARNAALPREERERLRAQARRDDLLHGRVSEAVASWSL